MPRKSSLPFFAIFALAACLSPVRMEAQTDLRITYGSNGIQQLSYRGVVLEDVGVYPADAFHIGHMKSSDLNGNVVTTGQYGWGENHTGRRWDAASSTMIYTFIWGSINVRFVQTGNTLDMNTTVTNNASSGIIFDGAAIFPLALHFPQLPVNFVDRSFWQVAFNTTGPSVTVADWGSGEVAAVDPDANGALYSGFEPTGNGISYYALISGTAPDSLAAFYPRNDRPVAPGQTDSYTVSLRFAPSGTSTSTLAADVYRNWAARWPPQLVWTDRRIIGALYLASSAQGDITRPAGFPNNPRRYFNDANASDFDVRTVPGLALFQAKVLQQANDNVSNMRRLNAQGGITWDVEGQEYPQTTSYVCAPDQIAQVAPEMESVISNTNSPYNGMKLDDAYFKIMRDAGFRVGVCVRPQHFTKNADGTASQVYLDNSLIAGELIRKMRYAHDRWGATLFYMDSTVDVHGGVLDPSIFQQAAAALPDSLLIPEESTPKFYAYTAPFKTFIFHLDTGTDPSVYNYYPAAFSVNRVNDVDPALLAQYRPQLTESVRRGDILIAHADYWQANNPTIVQIYADAGVVTPPPVTPPPVDPPPVTPPPVDPPPVTPPPSTAKVAITSPSAGQTISGSVSVVATVSVNLDAAGSYLMVDGVEVGTSRVTGPPFVYGLDTTGYPNGSHTLQIWAHDTANNTQISDGVQVTVANSSSGGGGGTGGTGSGGTGSGGTGGGGTGTGGTGGTGGGGGSTGSSPVTLTYPASGQTVSGVITATATITANLDAAGSYLMIDGVEVGTRRVNSGPYLYDLDTGTVAPGPHTLQVWAHTTNNDTLLSGTVQITVTR